ncbi:MAG TPA: C4-type zinc ribbon domain-containing protein [Clostridia bacterium]|nr:C4-type zinc ribbon domain-containing protein [Clostridia bacterium]
MNLPLLYKLQDLHKEMDIISKKLKELHEARDLKKLREEYQRLREQYDEYEVKLKKNAYRQETRNNEIKNLEYNKKTCEGIKFSRETDTVKKLETIEKQLEKVEEKRQEAENDIIELINEADNINKELTETKKRMAFIKKKYLNSKESTEKLLEELQAQKSELDPKIESIIKEVDKESYEMYSRLLKAHSDPVARVEGHKCSGCKMEVSDMDYEALKSGSDHMRCQSCGRLLYYSRP